MSKYIMEKVNILFRVLTHILITRAMNVHVYGAIRELFF